jgi:flagellar motility protein MotE (MotC chaperone)
MAVPRLLPVVAVAIGGVLAVQALSGAPKLLSASRALAEDVAGKGQSKPAVAPDASISTPVAAAKPAASVCAPTASELAKEAGLSPAELQVLQSLGDRRGQLDQREQDLDTQVQLMAAAEAKLDKRIAEMNGLKSDITGLLSQADQQQDNETARLIRVYEAMKPKDAAGRITLMDDSVRLPLAAKMKERALAAILAQMPAEDAKNLTEKLAGRVKNAQSVADARTALNPPADQPAAPPAQAADAAPAPAFAPAAATADVAAPAKKKLARAKPHARPKVKAQLAAADTQAKPPTPAAKTPATPLAGAPPAAVSAPPAKTG